MTAPHGTGGRVRNALRSLSGRTGVPSTYSQIVRKCTLTYYADMTWMTSSEARATLPELLTRVDEGDEITITRHGHPVAVMVRPDALRSRRAQSALADAERVHELLATARATALHSSGGMSPQRAEQLVGEIRAGRAAR